MSSKKSLIYAFMIAIIGVAGYSAYTRWYGSSEGELAGGHNAHTRPGALKIDAAVLASLKTARPEKFIFNDERFINLVDYAGKSGSRSQPVAGKPDIFAPYQASE